MIGHEIIENIIKILHASGTAYPQKYVSSSIMMGGSVDVQFRQGDESPDFSLYDVKEWNPDSCEVYENDVPTIEFEVAYTQSARDVSFEAGRHICLTGGDILLIVVIDVKHKWGSKPRKLEAVTWSHWEEHVDSYREYVDEEGDESIVVRAEREAGEHEEEHVLMIIYNAVQSRTSKRLKVSIWRKRCQRRKSEWPSSTGQSLVIPREWFEPIPERNRDTWAKVKAAER
jgi:hypothetical protein